MVKLFVAYVRGDEMDIDIRKAVIANMKNNNTEQLEDTIVEAIKKGEEKTLPGLGVLLELIWEASEAAQKDEMIQVLEQGIQAKTLS